MAVMKTLFSAAAKTSVKKHTSSGISLNAGALSNMWERSVPPYQCEQEEQYKQP